MAHILFRVPVTASTRAALQDRYTIHEVSAEATPEELAASYGDRVRVLATTGTVGASRELMAALPHLALICCLGTGHENVDLAAAQARGIAVTHGAGSNAVSVADHAMALLLAVMRDLPRLDQGLRQGLWRDDVGPRPIPTGKRLGLLGLGGIGERIARRAAGFDMIIAYCTRRAKPDVPWRHVPTVLQLAEESDCLIAAVPGGAETFHMVDATVLRALGPHGFLVNVGRGTVVDSEALAEALHSGTIAGAALDVFEGEPGMPARLRGAPGLVATPHVAAWSPEARAAGAALLRRNIDNVLGGQPAASPVPAV